MKQLILSTMLISSLIVSCGEEDKTEETAPKKTVEENKKVKKEVVKTPDTDREIGTDNLTHDDDLPCVEENMFEVDSDLEIGEYDVKSVVAYRKDIKTASGKSGQSIVVNFSNEELNIGKLEVKGDNSKDQWVFQLSFGGHSTDKEAEIVPLAEGEYAACAEYEGEPGVTCKVINDDKIVFSEEKGIKGSGRITGISAKRICGEVELENNDGTRVKTKFSAPIVSEK